MKKVLQTWPKSDKAAQVNISFWHDLCSLLLSLTDGSPWRSTITFNCGSLCCIAKMFFSWHRCWTMIMSDLLSTQAFAVSSRLKLALMHDDIQLKMGRHGMWKLIKNIYKYEGIKNSHNFKILAYPDIIAAKWQIKLWWQDEFPMIPTECCLGNPNSINALATAYKDARL